MRLSRVWDVALVPTRDLLPVFAKVVGHRDGPPSGDVLRAMGEAREWVRVWLPEELESGTPAAHLWVFGLIPSKTYGGGRESYDPASPTDQSLLVGWKFQWAKGSRRGVWERGRSHYWATERCERIRIPTEWSALPQAYVRRSRRNRIAQRRRRKGPG